MTDRKTATIPASRTFNQALADAAGEEVVKFEVLDVTPGAHVTVTFVSAGSPWRQGVWIGTEGAFLVDGRNASQLELWMGAEGETVEFDVEETDGVLRLYNIWDSGRGIKPYERLAFTTGMVRRDAGDHAIEYRCHNLGHEPVFDDLVFTIGIG